MQHTNTAAEETVFDEDGFDEWTVQQQQQQQQNSSAVPALLGTHYTREMKTIEIIEIHGRVCYWTGRLD